MVGITCSNENRRRFFVCLHGAGPICKKIKDVHWGGQANEKRRPGGRPQKNLYIKKYTRLNCYKARDFPDGFKPEV